MGGGVNMLKYTLFLGLNDSETLKQTISTKQAKKIISSVVNGCTISECIGVYTNLQGIKTIENTLKIEIIDFDKNIDIKKIIDELGLLFHQESIALQKEYINSELIYTKQA